MSSGEQCCSKRSSVLPSADRARTRGATAATAGSAKCARSGANHPAATSMSASRNTTSGVLVTRQDSLRAAAGPRATSRWMRRAQPPTATSAMAPGSWDPSSATTTRAGAGRWAWIDLRSRARPSGSSRTGTAHVTSAGLGPPGGGAGWASPASKSRRPSLRAARLVAGAPARSPASRLAACSDRCRRRIGEPPSSVRPSALHRASGSRRTPNPSGISSSRALCALSTSPGQGCGTAGRRRREQ